MSEDTNQDLTDAGATIAHDSKEASRQSRTTWKPSAAIGIALAAVIGIGVVAAHGAGWGPGGWRGGMGEWFAERGVSHLLDEIGASDEQETKIWAVIDRTRSDLRPMRREFRETRERVIDLLGAATIDKAALEALRAERIAALDEASKKAVSAIAEVAEVLTPEQRAKLLAEIKERREGRW